MFTVSPDTIDVNIHPTKNEIKFENENAIWPILTQAVKTSLGKFSAVPSIDFNSDELDVRPLQQGEMPKAPDMGFRPDYNPFEEVKRHTIGQNYRPTQVTRNWSDIYPDPAPRSRMETPEPAIAPAQTITGLDTPGMASGMGAICIQFNQKYIITTQGESLLVIDQHRAHVKILYEEYLQRTGHQDVVSQPLMFPEKVTLDESQQMALAGVLGNMESLGFSLEYLSDSDWQINAVPSMVKAHEAKDVLLRVLDSVTEDSVNYGNEYQPGATLRQKVALVMARSGAIRRGVKLSNREMEDIIARLFALPDPSLTPNGNKVYTLISESGIASLL